MQIRLCRGFRTLSSDRHTDKTEIIYQPIKNQLILEYSQNTDGLSFMDHSI